MKQKPACTNLEGCVKTIARVEYSVRASQNVGHFTLLKVWDRAC